MVIKAELAQPMIDQVPGMAPFDESQLPNRGVVPIAPENVTPAMMNHAIGSPYNKAALSFEKPAEVAPAAQHAAGATLEAANVVLDTESVVQPQQGNELSEADRAKIRQEVNKNISLTQTYGSTNFNQSK